jgi:predicted  nucleic acid-binding Zn-ribbon protein
MPDKTARNADHDQRYPTRTEAENFLRRKTTFKSVTATYSLTLKDYLIVCDGTFNVNLPVLSSSEGYIFIVKNNGAGVITINPDGAETIEGAATYNVASGESVTVYNITAEWILI